VNRPRTYLAAEVSGAGRHPSAWRLPGATAAQLFTAEYWAGLARLAETAGLDFLAIPDSFVPPTSGAGEWATVRGRLDAVAIAARVAPLTSTVGLVPTATTTHTEPFHLSKAIATLDFVSLGRAGWQPAVSASQEEAELFGRKDAAAPNVLWREAADAVTVVVRLWDSWEDDAVIRDTATGRYVDRDKLHYIEFSGEFFSVKGPSITPRSPQAHPLVVVHAGAAGTAGADPGGGELLNLIGTWSDVVRVAAPDLRSAARARRRVRDAVRSAGRDPNQVAVLTDIETLLAPTEEQAARTLDQLEGWAAEAGLAAPAGTLRSVGTARGLADLIGEAVAGGASDGVTLVPLALPSGLRAVADDLVPMLVERGLRPAHPATGTLRERFGLARPANYFTANSHLSATEANT
jgi:alkanesulfonate monooxygenase SsuD/methylene tetrahydromethanopterin reductase-like flavin-dependent oxidoreductase (luciferase family)